MNFNKFLEQQPENSDLPLSNPKISSFQNKKSVNSGSLSTQNQKKISGFEEELQININPENFQYDINNLKPENLFETLELKNDIDILCIKAKNAHTKYDIAKAYEISVK